MTELDHIFICVTLVGAFLAHRVVREGSDELQDLQEEIEKLRLSAQEHLGQASSEKEAMKEVEAEYKNKSKELSVLQQRHDELSSQIKARSQAEERKRPTRFRIDLGRLSV